MRNKIIEIAIAEIGYKEGAGNSNKYSQELYGNAQEWCADFVRWCLIKAGAGDLYPVSSYVPTIAEWYDKKGQYKNSKAKSGNYTPVVGDIILFDYNRNTTSDHIGLVEKVENGKVYTIEGNKDQMVKRCEYNLDSTDIRAYCVPNYPVQKVLKSIVETKYKTVTAKIGLNIRKEATPSAKRIGGVPYNSRVQILQENVATNGGYNWDKIKYGSITGYVANKYLK